MRSLRKWRMSGDETGVSRSAAIDDGGHYQMTFLHSVSGLVEVVRRKLPVGVPLIEMRMGLMKARSGCECRGD